MSKKKNGTKKTSPKRSPKKISKISPKKKSASASVSRTQNVVIRVQAQTLPFVVPTESQLMEPLKDGKKMTLQKTWLSENQLLKMLQRTPPEMVYKRKGRGGSEFDYVQGSYCIKWLNFTFGWNWDFEVVQEPTVSEILELISKGIDQIWVTGKLTVRSPDSRFSVVKTQTGKAEIKLLRESKKPMDIGNDLKAANTDALKKCASLLGFASDIYGKSSFKEETGLVPRKDGPTVQSSGSHETSSHEANRAESEPVEPIYCHGFAKRCPDGAELTQQERDFSVKVYGKPLCRACQKLSKPLSPKK